MVTDEIAKRRGWKVPDKHPEDGVVAPVYQYYKVDDREIVLWGEVNEEVSYAEDVNESDMAVEYSEGGELIDGWVFEDEEAALACVTLLLCGRNPSNM